MVGALPVTARGLPMQLWDTRLAYGRLSKLIHWLIATLVACLFGLAWIFINLDEGSTQAFLVLIHRSLGAIVLCLGLGRIAWRTANGFPMLPATVGHLEALLARTVQI